MFCAGLDVLAVCLRCGRAVLRETRLCCAAFSEWSLFVREQLKNVGQIFSYFCLWAAKYKFHGEHWSLAKLCLCGGKLCLENKIVYVQTQPLSLSQQNSSDPLIQAEECFQDRWATSSLRTECPSALEAMQLCTWCSWGRFGNSVQGIHARWLLELHHYYFFGSNSVSEQSCVSFISEIASLPVCFPGETRDCSSSHSEWLALPSLGCCTVAILVHVGVLAAHTVLGGGRKRCCSEIFEAGWYSSKVLWLPGIE